MSHIETPSIDSEGGFKGVGEGGLIGAVPAVTNAVADALSGIGVNINRIPLRPSYLSTQIRQANRTSQPPVPAKEPGELVEASGT